MNLQSLSACEECLQMLSETQQSFKRVEFLKKLTKISNNPKYHKTSLFLYCLYSILHKFDYVQALQAIEKSQGVDQGSMLSISIAKLIRALLYTYIDKYSRCFTFRHRDSLNLMKQACALMKSSDSISLEMKNHYKRMIPLIISNLNTSNGKKSFYKFFNQIYDDLAKQSSQNQLNQEILYSIHAQIHLLKSQIDFLPTLRTNKSNIQHRVSQSPLQKSLSATKVNAFKQSSLNTEPDDDYMGFAKPLTKEQKSVNNIRKMIEEKKQPKTNLRNSRSSSSINKSINGFTKNTPIKTMLKNQSNPYQLNLYAQEKPQCEFL